MSLAFCLIARAQAQTESPSLDVRFVTNEAEAALAVLDRRAAGEAVGSAEWDRLFASEGYRRLAAREESMGRPFTRENFRAFLLADSTLAKRDDLRATLAAWKKTPLDDAAARALTYLPSGSTIRAKVYPVIKPRSNSFVFDVSGDPAIFLFLDPRQTEAQFENTVAHELHHIGYAQSCADDVAAGRPAPSDRQRSALSWIGAFGEGFAMLAAAGGPDIHPHAVSPASDRERWDAEVADFDMQLAEVQSFLLDVLAGRMDEAAETKRGYSYFGVQGPWYTAGWVMATTLERAFGRSRVIECFCDQALLLPTFNAAVEKLAK